MPMLLFCAPLGYALPGTNIELEHGPLEDHVPLEPMGGFQVPGAALG